MQRKALFNPPTKAIPPETFAIVVEEYSLSGTPHTVIGRRIDSDERVTVFLREDIEKKAGARFARPEMKAYAAPRKDKTPATVPGGILLIEDAKRQQNGLFSARWITPLSHYPGEAEVFMPVAYVTPVMTSSAPGREGRLYCCATFIHASGVDQLSEDMRSSMGISTPVQVNNMNDLRAEMSKLMIDKSVGIGVRLRTEDGFDGMYASMGGKKQLSKEQAIEGMISSMSNEITAAVDSGRARLEIIPFSSIFAGPAALDVFSGNKVMQNKLSRYQGPPSEESPDTTKKLFRRSIVAVRNQNSDGKRSAFLTHITPLMDHPPLNGLNDAIAFAKTEHFDPISLRQEATDLGQYAAAPVASASPEIEAGEPLPMNGPAKPIPEPRSSNSGEPSSFAEEEEFVSDAFSEEDLFFQSVVERGETYYASIPDSEIARPSRKPSPR